MTFWNDAPPGGRRRRWASLALLAAALTGASTRGGVARAAPDAGGPSADAPATLAPVVPPLRPLPRYREPEPQRPTPEARRRLVALLDRLASSDASVRFAARREALDVDETWLSAIVWRLARHADSGDKQAMKALLKKIRRQARGAIRRQMEAAGKQGKVVTPDYLEMLLAHDDRGAESLRPLTEVVALSRMLEAVGTLPAVRELVNIRVRFGEFLRADTQLALARLKGRSTAALIEATRHPAPSIAAWAERQLSIRGLADPSDALGALTPEVRADVLRAYGKVKRLDTARLLLSYAASESAPVRLAARQAVAMLGEAVLWPLRDAYEGTVGERAPREWPWKRVARELFARFDGERLRELYDHYNRGRAAAARGDLAAATSAFDAVLTRDPSFEHASLMARVYYDHGAAAAAEDRDAALLSLSRAERLAEDATLRKRARSLRLTLDAERLLDEHVVDEVLLRRARKLDPDNARAARVLDSLSDSEPRRREIFNRYSAAAVISGLMAIGLLVITLRQRQSS